MNARRIAPRSLRHADDRGAALLFALGVMILVGLISAGMMAYITTAVRGRSTLDTLRNRQYAADAGIEYAITQVNALAVPGQTICGPPAHPTYYSLGAPLPNNIDIRVECENAPTPVFVSGRFVQQRNVILRACMQAGVACDSTTGVGTIIRAQVNFAQQNGTVVIQSWSVNG